MVNNYCCVPDSLNQSYFTRLCGEYETVCQDCLAEVDKIRCDLIERGVCTEQKAQQVVQERCLPLVGQQQTAFEKSLEEMDVRQHLNILWIELQIFV